MTLCTAVQVPNHHHHHHQEELHESQGGGGRTVTPYQERVLEAMNKEQDEHELFLLSFAPALRRLNFHRQAMARLRMQALFLEIEFGEQ